MFGFLLSPCLAGEEIISNVRNSINTDVHIINDTSVDYGWVGIKNIKTVIKTEYEKKVILKEVLSYDASGLVAELRITEKKYVRIDGRWILCETSVMTPIEPFFEPPPRYAQYLGHGDVFAATVITNLPPFKSHCKVSTLVTTLDGSGTPTDDVVAEIEDSYIFNPNKE